MIGTAMAIGLGAAAAFGGSKVASKLAKPKGPAAPDPLAVPRPSAELPFIQGNAAAVRARLKAQAGRRPTVLGSSRLQSSWDKRTVMGGGY